MGHRMRAWRGGVFATAMALAPLPAGLALADLRVGFVEGAPTDRFTVENIGACPAPRVEVTIDLADTAAGLYFDTTSAGAGVQVYQPLRIARGADLVETAPEILDGQTALSATLVGLAPGETVVFTIDVDDSQTAGPRGRTQIDGSEIAGAAAHAVFDGFDAPETARFGPDGRALIAAPGCVS